MNIYNKAYTLMSYVIAFMNIELSDNYTAPYTLCSKVKLTAAECVCVAFKTIDNVNESVRSLSA